MRILVPLPVVVPLGAAAVTLGLYRHLIAQRVITVAALAGSTAAAVAVLVQVETDGTAVVQIGSWPAPAGINFVADLFTGLLLVISAVTVLVVLVFAVGQRSTDEGSPYFHPVYLVLAAGVSLAFVTGDLFNLFVAIEVMLTASYVLITLGGSRNQVRAGMTYVVINLLGSLILLSAVALIYAATGTVNMAQLVGRMAELPGGVRETLVLLLVVALGIKAAVFPLFFWLPDSYPTAPAPVTAVFAGLLTKVGVYAIIRTQLLLSPHDGPSSLLLLVAGLTMIVGVLGAIAQDDMKRILSFHIISQIGYMIMGLAFFTVAGIAGAIFFIVHQIPVKTSLFLVGGIVEQTESTSSLARISGLARKLPITALLFMLAALSLAGAPPLSGFVGKLALVEAGFDARQWAIVGVSLLGSLLTLFSMTKIWSGVFWGPPEPMGPARASERAAVPTLMLAATGALVGVTLAIALGASLVYDLSERAASDLVDPAIYARAVLGR